MLDEKIIVVTGGAGLLGRVFCQSIAAQRARVIVADLDLEAAKKVVHAIKANKNLAEAAALDITNPASLDDFISTAHHQFGRIDAVVNNAYPRNKNWGQSLENVTYTDFCENLNLHLGGYFLTTQKFALYFREQGGGNIINMASIYGTLPPRFDIYAETAMSMPVEYAAIKSAIIQLTRYFAQYFKSDGIRCNTLSPGGILDKQPELFQKQYKNYCGTKGMLEANDIAGSLIYLLSDASRFVTGQNLIVDDGFCL